MIELSDLGERREQLAITAAGKVFITGNPLLASLLAPGFNLFQIFLDPIGNNPAN